MYQLRMSRKSKIKLIIKGPFRKDLSDGTIKGIKYNIVPRCKENKYRNKWSIHEYKYSP